jgi:hypothetical protein
MLCCLLPAGTDFYDVYTGVGARRIRETFEMLRNFAPAVLFVDEFDALGAARGAASAGDESASIINELLVQVGCTCTCCSGCVIIACLRACMVSCVCAYTASQAVCSPSCIQPQQAVLFVVAVHALGAAHGAASAGDESASIINCWCRCGLSTNDASCHVLLVFDQHTALGVVRRLRMSSQAAADSVYPSKQCIMCWLIMPLCASVRKLNHHVHRAKLGYPVLSAAATVRCATADGWL